LTFYFYVVSVPELLKVTTVFPGTAGGFDIVILGPERLVVGYIASGIANLATPEPPFPPRITVGAGALF